MKNKTLLATAFYFFLTLILICILVFILNSIRAFADYKAAISAEQVEFENFGKNPIKIHGEVLLKRMVNELQCMSLHIFQFKITSSNIPEIRKLKLPVAIDIEPLNNNDKSRKCLYEIEFLNPEDLLRPVDITINPTNDFHNSAFATNWRQIEGKDFMLLELSFPKQNKNNSNPAFIKSIYVNTDEEEELEIRLRDCEIKYQNQKIKIDNGEKYLKGIIKEGKNIKFGSTIWKKEGTLELYFDKKFSIGISEDDTLIRKLTIRNFTKGQILIIGDKTVDLNEEFKEDSDIEIGDKQLKFKELIIDKSGINMSFQGNSKDIKVNDFQKRGTCLDLMLKNKLNIIFGAIIFYFIDKIFIFLFIEHRLKKNVGLPGLKVDSVGIESEELKR